MTKLIKRMNWMLLEIHKNRWISLSKDDSEISFDAKAKLAAYGLIERQGKLSWKLTKEGYEAVELGGYEEWLSANTAVKSNDSKIQFKGGNVSIISGYKNSVNQSNSDNIKLKNDSVLKRILIGVSIIVIAGLIMIFVNSYFGIPEEKQIKHQYSENPINLNNPLSLEFVEGEKGIVYYSLSLELMDSLLIQTTKKFSDPDKAIFFINERVRNEMISTMEKIEISYARQNRDSITNVIMKETYDDQKYSGYKIKAININEIKTGAKTK